MSSSEVVGRRRSARSRASRMAIRISQPPSGPSPRNVPILRYAVRKASCAASSASDGSARMRRQTASTIGASRSTSARKASRSPPRTASTRARSSSRVRWSVEGPPVADRPTKSPTSVSSCSRRVVLGAGSGHRPMGRASWSDGPGAVGGARTGPFCSGRGRRCRAAFRLGAIRWDPPVRGRKSHPEREAARRPSRRHAAG